MSDPNTPSEDANGTPPPGATPPQGGPPTVPPQAPAHQQPPAPPQAPVHQQPVHQQQYQQYPAQPPQQFGYSSAPTPEPKGLAITALVLGLVAIVGGLIFSWIPFVGGVITILVAIAAIILGAIALRKRQSKGMSLTGLITGGVALLIGIGAIIAWAAFFASANVALDEYSSSLDELQSELDQYDLDSEFN